MAERSNVFVSSTSRDLEPYRNAVTRTILQLGMYPVIMEAFNPTDASALQLCYDRLQQADIFVGIYAHRYGYAPGTQVAFKTTDGEIRTGDGQTGITHFEYMWAMERGLPALLFVLDDKDDQGKQIQWEEKHIEDEPGRTRLKVFKNLIMSRHVVGFFYSPDSLAARVATAIYDLMLISPDSSSHVARLQTLIKTAGSRVADVSYYFRNRDRYRGEIARLLLQPSTRLISVIGRGGIGKTAIVSKVLHEIETQAAGASLSNSLQGIIYLSTRTTGISLEKIFDECVAILDDEDDRQKLTDIWKDLKLPLTGKVDQLLKTLSASKYLILLDNMEDLLDRQRRIMVEDLHEFFMQVLRTTHNVCLLITSREPIELPGDLMRFDHRIIVSEGLPFSEAVAVLRDLDPHGEYGLRDANEDLLQDIVQKVHGVPRALEIVASILAHDPQLSVLELGKQHEIFTREEFVQALVQENFKRLDPDARRVVEALAVFGTPVSTAALSFLLEPFLAPEAVRSILNQLIQSHAVTFDRNNKMVSLHPIDQDYIYYQIPE